MTNTDGHSDTDPLPPLELPKPGTSESVEIAVTIQIEHCGEQLVRGKPIGPWKCPVVGASAEEVLRRAQQQLGKKLPKSLPTSYFDGALPEQHEAWTTTVSLPPVDRSQNWSEPVTIALDSFRWQLDSGHCVIKIPAVGCTLFGKPHTLHDAEVLEQARMALLRVSENLNLLELRQRFASRRFEFHCLRISVPLSEAHEKSDGRKKASQQTSTLRASASDLTTAKLPPVFGLDAKATELADHFRGESPQSVLLIGQPGVGKTSLVHRMVTMRSELGLEDRKVWSTSGARIVSGMSGMGMWQQRCAKLIRQAHSTRAIVHLGSLFELLEAGKIDGQPGVASMVRAAVSRRRLQAIAECTPEQLAFIERNDPMLLRVFTRMELQESGREQIQSILQQYAAACHPHVRFNAQAIEELERLHSRFATYSALPAAALRLMRTMDDRIATDANTPHETANIPSEPNTIDASAVARAFARQTGLPRFLVDDSMPLDLDQIHQTLSAGVIGQAEPVDLVVNLVATLKARLVRPGRPLASMMFIGPTGVGKTEMAKAIARLLYSDARRMLRIDMSEYATPWAAAKLIGKTGEGDGTLTSPIREQPFSVVLLDEFEKADPAVFDLLLQLLGEGRLTDAQGRLADFRNAVVIMTSNLGVESFRESSFGFGGNESDGWRAHFNREVRKFVRPEFLGRIDRIVPFQPLSKDVVRQVALRELDLLSQRSGLKYSQATLDIDPSAVDLLSELGYQPKYGARPLRRAIEEHVTVPLANALSGLSGDSVYKFRVSADGPHIKIAPEKISTKTQTAKESEAKLLNSWQELNAMSRAAMTSPPLRALENELERNARQNEIASKKLQAASSPSRIRTLKTKIAQIEAAIADAGRIRDKLTAVTSDIQAEHLKLMLAWYRNEPFDADQARASRRLRFSAIRQAIQEVLNGRIKDSSLTTLLVTGGGPSELSTLWSAYLELAAAHHWSTAAWLVKPHNAGLLRPRAGSQATAVHELPASRLLGVQPEDGSEPKALCDLFPPPDNPPLPQQWKAACGFLIEFRGESVGSWLSEEHGIVHFFDPRENGAKRRVRVKLQTFDTKFRSIELSEDWQQPVAQGDRDPLRTFHAGDSSVIDRTGKSINFTQGKRGEAYLQLIKHSHEQALWNAIGYQAIPSDAMLHREFEVPF